MFHSATHFWQAHAPRRSSCHGLPNVLNRPHAIPQPNMARRPVGHHARSVHKRMALERGAAAEPVHQQRQLVMRVPQMHFRPKARPLGA